jgi:hypothetical protein
VASKPLPLPRTPKVVKEKKERKSAPATPVTTQLLPVPMLLKSVLDSAPVVPPAVTSAKRSATTPTAVKPTPEKRAKVTPSSAAAAAGAGAAGGRGLVLNHLVATTLSAPRFAADYECCTWNPLPPGWVSTASGVSGSFGGSVGHAVVGLDCEMVQAAEPYGTSLARVTVVALGAVKPGAKRADCVVLLDELVSEKANPLEHSVPHNASCCTTHAQLRNPRGETHPCSF